ncbi:hypothetical protein HA466_0303670 [Hirschfeldia incana]|nr:hypothetical protein HA466_0303670 [Hirschfeldia incana]
MLRLNSKMEQLPPAIKLKDPINLVLSARASFAQEDGRWETARAQRRDPSTGADENKIIIGGSGAIPALGNKGRAVRAGIVPALVKKLSDSSSHRGMVDEALTILSVLASNLDAKSAMVKANTLPALIGILQTGQGRNRENAAAILLSLCKRDNERLVLIGRLGAVVPLMELSKNGTERGQRKAASLLELLRKACQ